MKKYTILKGFHYSFFLIGRLFGWHYNKKKFIINFKFDPTCWWFPCRNNDDKDLNKLSGISFGLFGVHKNSIRLTWRPNFEKSGIIEIHGYMYDDEVNEHESRFIGEVEVDKLYSAKIECTQHYYYISLGDKKIKFSNISFDPKIQKELYPFFGGNNSAPNKMYIWTEIIAKN